MRLSPFRFTLFGAGLVLAVAPLTFGHIRIAPTQSSFGAREKYTMRVPNEKQTPTIRVEGEFPVGLQVYDFEFKPGWKVDFKKDDKGKIVGATWTGKIAPYEFVEFGMLAINPKSGDPNLLWKFHQYYEDGSKEDFVSPPDAKMPLLPMPQVTLSQPSASLPVDGVPSGASSGSARTNSSTAGSSRASLVEQGSALFKLYKCYDCHGMKGEGTKDGPDLVGITLSPDEIAEFLRKPSADALTAGMPDFPGDNKDVPPLVAFVSSLKR